MSRRQARELALQVLFAVDLGQGDPQSALRQAIAREMEESEGASGLLGESDSLFAQELVLGTWAHKDAIDAIIATYAREWTVERMSGVDRNVLRLAVYEITHRADVPDSVAADEAVELAKTFSTADSGKFVNGILGSVIRGQKQGAARAEPTATEQT